MITFHNDHLVGAGFCKLMYQTVPEWLHVPIVFNAHTDEYRTRGTAYGSYPYRIELNLQGIYYQGATGVYPDFGYWKYLLDVAYHEFGHFATHATDYKVREYDNGYDAGKDDYDAPEREAYRYIEKAADDWRDLAMLRLLEYDKRLAQPDNLGAYFNGREAKRNKWRNSTDFDHRRITRYRLRKSGGQYTITETARLCGEIGPHYKPNTGLIRRLASDLAYLYTDNAGRLLYFFAHGDVPEIKQRVAEYRAIHPKREPKPTSWEVWLPTEAGLTEPAEGWPF
jgi:hypothetical protein